MNIINKFLTSENPLDEETLKAKKECTTGHCSTSQPENTSRSIHVYLGSPDFKPFASLSKDALAQELEHVRALLKAHHIEVQSIGQYDDAVLYRFITEELVYHNMYFNINIEEKEVCVFTYEEFYPNPEYDIQYLTEEFLWSFFAKKEFDEYSSIFLFHTLKKGDDTTIVREESLSQIRRQQQLFPDRHFHQCTLKTLQITDNQAQASVELICTLHNNTEPAVLSASFEFNTEGNFYSISKVSIPGVLEF
jgi:hypothetical protein